MYNDADIEMRELEAAANAAAKVTSGADEVPADVRRNIVANVADAGFYHGSLFEALTDQLADFGLNVTSDVFDDMLWDASLKLRKLEEAERREMGY